MKVKFPPCFRRKTNVKTEFPARQKCHVSLSCITEYYWAPFLSRAPNIFELQCKQCCHHLLINITELWSKKRGIIHYHFCLLWLIAFMVLKYCECSHLQTKGNKKTEPHDFSLWSNVRSSFAEGKLWRRHYDAFLHRHLFKKQEIFFFQNGSFLPESNSQSTKECTQLYWFWLG